jgi:hypothetical protein
MKHLLFIVVSAFFLFSCSSTKYYSYKLMMERPVLSDRLVYENDTMSVTFKFVPSGIGFSIFNKLSNDGLRLNWDELSMSINGKAQRVVHKETGAYKINEVQPPTTIPPKTILEDQIVPSDNINYTYYAGSRLLTLKDVYPTTDGGNKKKRAEILKTKGQRITLFMPIYVHGIYTSNTFDFIIQDITESKNKNK